MLTQAQTQTQTPAKTNTGQQAVVKYTRMDMYLDPLTTVDSTLALQVSLCECVSHLEA